MKKIIARIKINKHLSILLLLVLPLSFSSQASLRDSETRMISSDRHPSVLQTITGEFIHHSKDYYFWKIENRLQQLKEYPDSLVLYDDLAVAYFQINEYEKSIEIMQKKEEINSHDYSTYMNLATFHFHQNDFTRAFEYINQALEFKTLDRRDLYHKYIIEYVFVKVKFDALVLPLQGKVTMKDIAQRRKIEDLDNFYNFLRQTINGVTNKKPLSTENLNLAIVGVLEVIRFSHNRSPILYEVLGDLLLAKGTGALAALSYLKASEMVEESAIEYYTTMANEALLIAQKSKPPLSLHQISNAFQEYSVRGMDFYKGVEKNEKFWIESGINPEDAFKEKYFPNFNSKDSTQLIPYESEIELILLLQGLTPDFVAVDTLYKKELLGKIVHKEKIDLSQQDKQNQADIVRDVSEKKGRILSILSLVILFNLSLAGTLYFIFSKKKKPKIEEPYNQTPNQ
jgi:tetratricopeptide (TPR) repeat protein